MPFRFRLYRLIPNGNPGGALLDAIRDIAGKLRHFTPSGLTQGEFVSFCSFLTRKFGDVNDVNSWHRLDAILDVVMRITPPPRSGTLKDLMRLLADPNTDFHLTFERMLTAFNGQSDDAARFFSDLLTADFNISINIQGLHAIPEFRSGNITRQMIDEFAAKVFTSRTFNREINGQHTAILRGATSAGDVADATPIAFGDAFERRIFEIMDGNPLFHDPLDLNELNRLIPGGTGGNFPVVDASFTRGSDVIIGSITAGRLTYLRRKFFELFLTGINGNDILRYEDMLTKLSGWNHVTIPSNATTTVERFSDFFRKAHLIVPPDSVGPLKALIASDISEEFQQLLRRLDSLGLTREDLLNRIISIDGLQIDHL